MCSKSRISIQTRLPDVPGSRVTSETGSGQCSKQCCMTRHDAYETLSYLEADGTAAAGCSSVEAEKGL
jgi:hypothetical protein